MVFGHFMVKFSVAFSPIMDSLSLPLDLADLQLRFDPLLQAITTGPFLQNIKPSTTADAVAVLLFLLTSLGYLTRGRLWDKADPHHFVCITLFEFPTTIVSVL